MPSSPEAPAATIPQLLARAIDRFGERDAVVTVGGRLTYAELDAQSRRLAASLIAMGFGRGSRVAFLLPNSPFWVVAFVAITRIGAVALPVSTFYQPPELRAHLENADVELLLLTGFIGRHDLLTRLEQAIPELASTNSQHLQLAGLPRLRSVVLDGTPTRSWARPASHLPMGEDRHVERLESAVAPSDVLTIIYTSGSTSEPKGVIHGHGSALRHAARLAESSGLSSADRVWTPLPLFWVGGLAWGLLRPMTVGGALLTQDVFSPDAAVELIRCQQATRGEGWLPVMRRVVAAASACPEALATITGGDLRAALDAEAGIEPPGVPLGMTETFGPHTYRSECDDAIGAPHRHHQGGRALPGVEHRIVDPRTGAVLDDGVEGVIAVRADSLMQGMYRRSAEGLVDTDGWFTTGDRGYLDSGWLTFTGRQNDMIKTGGSNVAPAEIENVLRDHPSVDAAFVVGVPSQDRGEDVVALVVVAPGAAEAHLDSLRIWLADRLSSYKVPRYIVAVTPRQVPLLATMKVDRRRLQDLAITLVDAPR